MATGNDRTSATDVGEGDMASTMQGWAAAAEETVRDLADNIGEQVREHPVRTLAIAGAAGFLLASVARPRILPALIRSGVGVAAAMALRKLAQNTFTGELEEPAGRD